MTRGARPAYLIPGAIAVVVFLAHIPLLNLPYFWDELGQFVPAALDIYRDGAWIPHSAVPNAHPPGVMAYLAIVWRLFGYSIPSTRVAMLLIACGVMLCTGLIAARLCHGAGVLAVFVPVILLALDPLFFTQSMMAQLDMPALFFTLLALLLFFAERHAAAGLACTALVMTKETGAILPVIFGLVLLAERRRSAAVWYGTPLAFLAIWFFLLWRATGQLFGDAGFTHYNLAYALNPVRASVSLLRRVYYLFLADFRWVGTIAILWAWRKSNLYRDRHWRLVWLFVVAHGLMVSLLGGAELERYLLPVLPLVYVAMSAAWLTLKPLWRTVSVAATGAGLLTGSFVNPPFPFPFENNLAMVDFVELHRSAAQFLATNLSDKTIDTAWPLTAALRNPDFGYVTKGMMTRETSDLHTSTLRALDPKTVDVLVVYSRTWEPSWSAIRWPFIERFLARYYGYEPEITAAEVQRSLGLARIRRWQQRGQWIEVYARSGMF